MSSLMASGSALSQSRLLATSRSPRPTGKGSLIRDTGGPLFFWAGNAELGVQMDRLSQQAIELRTLLVLASSFRRPR
ncbi:MAG: hypothetical protein RXR09_04305, partial [Acidilobus sp.]